MLAPYHADNDCKHCFCTLAYTALHWCAQFVCTRVHRSALVVKHALVVILHWSVLVLHLLKCTLALLFVHHLCSYALRVSYALRDSFWLKCSLKARSSTCVCSTLECAGQQLAVKCILPGRQWAPTLPSNRQLPALDMHHPRCSSHPLAPRSHPTLPSSRHPQCSSHPLAPRSHQRRSSRHK